MRDEETSTDAAASFDPERAALCVFASGSSGNCSALVHPTERGPRVTLIDLGLSPRRTRRLLALSGLALDHVDEILLTHLDSDHYNPAWRRALPEGAIIRTHRGHLGRAGYVGAPGRPTVPFESAFELRCGAVVRARMHHHDRLGAASFRIETASGSLGFATDVGRITDELVAHLGGVDVLAIESNYCPDMQQRSARPAYLKRRIMGGAGHLSNEQCADAARAMAPRSHVVLLHLSRQCNDPALAAAYHAAAGYTLIVSAHDRPTGWIAMNGQDRRSTIEAKMPAAAVVAPARRAASRRVECPAQLSLFGA